MSARDPHLRRLWAEPPRPPRSALHQHDDLRAEEATDANLVDAGREERCGRRAVEELVETLRLLVRGSCDCAQDDTA